MTQGRTPDTPELLNRSREFCDDVLAENSIYKLLFRVGHHLFPDDVFSDLYSGRGRQSVPPQVLAVCMVLQRLEGLSDREAVERFMFDARWKYAAGGLSPDYPGFVHTVLVGFRARLRGSESPNRIFEAVLEVAKQAGLVGHRRALDSTPLYDAVATQDTVTMIRASIRGVLRACNENTEAVVRARLQRDDAYETAGKPACDWDDAEARSLLVDALARDGYAIISFFDNEILDTELKQAVTLLATVLGQDLEENDEGLFRIARRVAKDRMISTVDPEARHGHKTSSRKFDGYKGHIAVDPDSEIVTSTAVTAGNAGDASVIEELLGDILPPPNSPASPQAEDVPSEKTQADPELESDLSPQTSDVAPQTHEKTSDKSDASETKAEILTVTKTSDDDSSTWSLSRFVKTFLIIAAWAKLGNRHNGKVEAMIESNPPPSQPVDVSVSWPQLEVYGDASYGTAVVLKRLDEAEIKAMTKVQQPVSRNGRFAQSEFDIDLVAGQVTCPQNITVALKFKSDGAGVAQFKKHCLTCPLRELCTTAKTGRAVNVHPLHETLHRHREQQREPDWQNEYRETRPKVERKIGHMMRRSHGGRKARVRGVERVAQDFSLLAAATNLSRLTRLGLTYLDGSWCTADSPHQRATV